MTRPDSSSLEQLLLDSIDADDIVSLASALIDAGGENPGDTEQSVANVLVDRCRSLGFDIEIEEIAPNRPNVIVSIGGSCPRAEAGPPTRSRQWCTAADCTAAGPAI